MPLGLGILKDGESDGGDQPDGHRTMYPTVRMTVNHFDSLFLNLGWVRADAIKKKKS